MVMVTSYYDTDQQRPGQVIAGQADLVKTHSELDSLQLGVILAYLASLASGAGGHHLKIQASYWLSLASHWLWREYSVF